VRTARRGAVSAALAATMGASISSAAHAAVSDCAKATAYRSALTVTVDEDWFLDVFKVFPKYNEDRNYTLGAGFSYASSRFNRCQLWLLPQTRLDAFFGLVALQSDYANSGSSKELREGFGADSFEPSPLGMVNQRIRLAEGKARRDLYWYGGLTQRAVLYNALLQGQFRHSVVRTEAANVERMVTEFQTGLTASLGFVELTWSVLAGRTPEFRGPQARPHVWSGLAVVVGGP